MKIDLTKHSTHARLFLTYKQPLARRIIPTLRETSIETWWRTSGRSSEKHGGRDGRILPS